MADLAITPLPTPHLVLLRLHRADQAAFTAASAVLQLPTRPGAVVVTGGVEATWVRPDGWLLRSGDAGLLIQRLTSALTGHLHQAIDWGPSRAEIAVSGRDGAALLASGATTPVDGSGLPIGHATHLRLADALVLVHRTDQANWRLTIERAMADWLLAWLEDAAMSLA